MCTTDASRPGPGGACHSRGRARAGIALLLIGAVLYGSFIPFRFDPSRFESSHFFSSFLRARDVSMEDAVVNVGLYTLLSAALLAVLPAGGFLSVIKTLLICVLLSVGVEAGQTFVPQRVSSATDVACNVSGAILGLVLFVWCRGCWIGIGPRFASHFRRNPWHLMGVALTVALMAYGLLPFDFVTSTAELHRSFQRLQAWCWPGNLSAMAGEICGAGWFVLLGFAITAGRIHLREPLWRSLAGALIHGLILSILIELLQIFTQSHVAEIPAVIIRSLACLGGAGGAVLVNSAGVPAHRKGATLSVHLLFVAAIFQAGVIFLEALSHRASTSPSVQLGAIIPFQNLWTQHLNRAGAHTISIMISAGILTLTVATLLRRACCAQYRPIAGVFVLGVYIAASTARAVSGGEPLDLTDAILALMACALALSLDRRLYAKTSPAPRL